MVIAMKSLWLNGQLLITALLVTILSLIGGCAPKVLVPPEQRAHIRGTVGGSIFAGAHIVAVDGEILSSANAERIFSPARTRLRFNIIVPEVAPSDP